MLKLSGFLLIGLALVNQMGFAANPPDLETLKQSGYIMGPGNAQNPVHSGWKNSTAVMKNVAIFDSIVDRIEAVVCGADTNKSVLLIGESSLAYQYVFARMASRQGSKCPSSMWHVDVNISKIESGHKYVGEVDEYWNGKVLAPADGKDVVMYFQSVDAIVGIGSHSNDQTGIEREWVANMTSGRMRTVAYSDKFQYNDLARSRNAYVVEAFADRIVLPPVEEPQTKLLAKAYLATLFPNLTLVDKELNYLVKTIAFYMPNRQEPDRSMSVLNALAKMVPSTGSSRPTTYAETVESKHPYDSSSNITWEIKHPESKFLALNFESFDLENGYDYVELYNGDTGVLLERFTGSKGAFQTDFYPTNFIKVVLKADNQDNKNGFKISGSLGKSVENYTFKHEDVRRAVMGVAQVPMWLIDKDYSVVAQLQGKLDGDVVGVTEGKKDMVRLAKNGFIAGRTDEKPVATVLLAGPTGTGKSYIAKKMAEFMGMKLITMDMTSYKETSSFKIFQATLANYLTNTPYAFYLFEEIDKASVEVLDQLYFMMDEGLFYDQYQRPMFARGAFIMMTTNAASKVILDNPNDPELRSKVMNDLYKSFRMSFLNRFDAVSIFKPFSDAEFAQLSKVIVNKKISKMKEFFAWNTTVDQGTYDYIAKWGRSAEFGARPMERMVESTMGAGIAEYQLKFGALEDEAHMAFTKLVPIHDFNLAVATRSTIDFTVDPSINSRRIRGDGFYKMWQVLQSDRMFDDK